ncbi:efflux RND transporter permease subunit [Gracilimonas sp.]|uniref:efflux RND transporter permease subunit n=1 Tax=Gracilimonas sp. TaxID=1974203 RepID=UPI0032ED4E04
MKLPRIAIENYRFVFVLVLLAMLVGVYSFFTMPRSEDPELSLPNYTITVVLPGTGPEDMEELVVDPIEEGVDKIENVAEIYTEITDGLAIIQVEGEFGIDYDEQYDDISSEINAIRQELPSGIQRLSVEQYKPEDRTVIMQLALVSNSATFIDLKDVADNIQDQLEEIKGVQSTEIVAIPREEIRVEVNFERLNDYGVSLDQLISGIRDENQNIPGGSINVQDKYFTIKTSGSFESLQDIKNMPIGIGRSIIRLSDVAKINIDHQDERWLARVNGNRAIYLAVKRGADENLIDISEKVSQKLTSIKENIRSDIQLDVVFEQAPAVKDRINGFFFNLLQGVLLVGLMIFLFLGMRSSAVVMIIIPIAMIITIGVLNQIGYGLQQISIASLVIALGLLVDNGIVVIENIVRFKKEGYSILESAIKGTSEVSYAIISSTVTTVLAFAPLAFLQSGPGEFLRSLPITVIITLIVSLILALCLTPIVANIFIQKINDKNSSTVDKYLMVIINRVYEPILKFALSKSIYVVIGALILFGGSLALFPSIGVSFFPTADKPMLLINVDTPEGSNIYRTDHAVRFIESVLDSTDYVEKYISNSGHGNPQVYYNRIPEKYKPNHGQVLVNFKTWDPKKFYSTLEQLREDFSEYVGGQISFRELKNGAPFNAPIEIRIRGQKLNTLKSLSQNVEKVIRDQEGTKDVDNPLAISKTDLKVEINKEKAALYNVSIGAIDRAVKAGISGLTIDQTTLNDGEEYPIVVRLPVGQSPSIDDFDNITVTSKLNEAIPIKQLIRLKFEQSIPQLLHYDLTRTTAVTANVINPDKTTEVTESIIEELDRLNWPRGYDYYVAGEYESQQESFGDLGSLLIIALIGIFAVLVLQFKSFLQPLIIFSAIPLAVTGSFIALFITNWSFSFFAFVGFISLVGIVVNNSIILVDYANTLIQEIGDFDVGLIKACKTRFTPIVLTTATTIVGLIPLTLSNTSLWSPLGWTIIGGMVSSTLLTLVIVPILYTWFTRKEEVI